MSHFCLLSAPDSYSAQDWDLLADEPARRYWLDHFLAHFETTLEHAAGTRGRTTAKQIAAARVEFADKIEQLRGKPDAMEDGLNVMSLCRMREKVLRSHKLTDPFVKIKERENAAAIKLYPQVVRKLHAMDGSDKWLHLIESVFAGNIFDLGSTATLHLAGEPTDFLVAVENTKPRPWLVDDFDALDDILDGAPPTPWAKAVVFVDNAGSDFILGVMPLVRELALCGTRVVLAANELPSLNDVTAVEILQLGSDLAAADAHLAALVQANMLEVVSTGNDLPLIDLSNVSDELNDAAADADLVVLEGMGRAIESNFNAQFKVDVLHLAMLKDEVVAGHIGGELFDCVCKFTPAE